MDFRGILFVIVVGVLVGVQAVFVVKPLLLRAVTYFTGASPEFTIPLKLAVVLLSLFLSVVEAVVVIRFQRQRPSR